MSSSATSASRLRASRLRRWGSEYPFAFTAARATISGSRTIPPPVDVADVLELGHGPILLLRMVDLVETPPHSPVGALVKVSLEPMLVRKGDLAQDEGASGGTQTFGAATQDLKWGQRNLRAAPL